MSATESGTELSPMERERRLTQASSDYMAGRITMDEYHDAEQRYGTDWLAVARTLAALDTRHSRLRRMMWRLFR